MNAFYMELIKLCLLGIKLKKQLIIKFAGSDDTVSKIIAQEARFGIIDDQRALQFFLKRKNSLNL